jgi:hypothetical protein
MWCAGEEEKDSRSRLDDTRGVKGLLRGTGTGGGGFRWGGEEKKPKKKTLTNRKTKKKRRAVVVTGAGGGDGGVGGWREQLRRDLLAKHRLEDRDVPNGRRAMGVPRRPATAREQRGVYVRPFFH